MTSFVNKSTTSKAKLETETYIESIIGKQKRKGLCVGLVGHVLGIRRHIKHWKSLGFRQDQLIILEICPKTHASQKAYCKKYFPKVRCVLGDGLAYIKQNAKKIEHIDWDSIETALSETEVELLKIFKKTPNIKSANINGSARGANETFEALCKKNGLRKTLHPYQGYLRYEKTRIMPTLLSTLLPKRISIEYLQYWGKCPMYLTILKKGA